MHIGKDFYQTIKILLSQISRKIILTPKLSLKIKKDNLLTIFNITKRVVTCC